MAKPKKTGLGKGLDALFGASPLVTEVEEEQTKEQVEDNENLKTLKITDVEPNRDQPRKMFNQESLEELADSIKTYGVIQPIVVTKKDGYYAIVAGERRWRAAKIAGLEEIPAIIRDDDEQTNKEIALIENIQREDLNAIEEAQAYQTMMEKLKLTQNELAKRIGKSRTHITNTLRLLNLPEKIQEYVLDGSLSMGHARALITLDKERALKIAKRVIDEKLSVRDVENIVKGFELQEARKNKPKVEKPKEYQYVEGLLRKKYRTRIKVDDKSITIKYSDTDDLNRLLELMGVIEES